MNPVRVVDETHDPGLRSWVETANAPDADFPIQNLPLGVFRRLGRHRSIHLGAAIGDRILDLHACRAQGLLTGLSSAILRAATAPRLNAMMALGPAASSALRTRLSEILRVGSPPRHDLLIPMDGVELCLPAMIGDFTDFYASIFHATNVGTLFRPASPLSPNYTHLPIAYHGRSSSIGVSPTAIQRPWGQIRRGADPSTVFEPSERLDYEAEVAMFVGMGITQGDPVGLDAAEQHIFGLCLLNDWSARDIQAWESQPLGPFLAKNFATTISPWVVTLEALAPFRVPGFPRRPEDPPLLPYLSHPRNEAVGGVDLTIDVSLQSKRMREQKLEPVRLGRGSFRDMYWTMAQMVTHHASNGCNLRPGDLIASGTVSGPDDGARGCLLEITQGFRPLALPDGETRLFLADGDEVTIRGFCERAGYARIGFGSCSGVVRPARAHSSA
jgi:fumarylacetoacetase